MRCLRAAAVVLALLLGLLAPALAQEIGGRKVALVIGNGAYRYVGALANPGNDARLIAATLKAEGFTLVGGGAQTDLDKPHFDAAVQAFGQQIAGAAVALFYYSGHGLQVNGTNYLVPVSANPTREQDLDFQMVSADLVLRQMNGSGTRLNIIILDACRNNPFGGRGLRATGGGLAEMKAPDGTLISYATQPGSVASDGVGRDSPFTTALVDAMRQPGVDIFRMFNKVGLAVKQTTAGQQEPWLSASPIEGDFAFASGAAPAPAAAPPAAATPPAPAAPKEAAAPAPPEQKTAALVPPLRPSAPPPQSPPPAPQAAAPGMFACPAKGTVVTGETQTFDWTDSGIAVREVTSEVLSWQSLGEDPKDPAVCLRTGKTGRLVRHLGDWFDADALRFTEDPVGPILGLLQGQSERAHFRWVARHPVGNAMQVVWFSDWKRRGHETFTLGGQAYDTLVFDITESSSRNSFVGAGRMWYAPALHLFLRRAWRHFSSDDVVGWSVTNIGMASQ